MFRPIPVNTLGDRVVGLGSSFEVGESSRSASQESGKNTALSTPHPRCRRGVPHRFVTELARRCSALIRVPEFAESQVVPFFEEEDSDEDASLNDQLGVYLLEFEDDPVDEEKEEEEDSAELYASGVRRFDEPTAAVEEPTKEINLGTPEDPRIVYISANLSMEVEEALVQILHDYKDSFAWSYEDMPGLDPSLVEHRLVLKSGARAIKQRLRRLHPKTALKVKEEIDKLHKARVIRVVLYPQWVANIVPVAKKDG